MHADIERLAADELARIDRHFRALEALHDDPAFRVLRDARLAGITRRRWDTASTAVMSATSRLGKWRETVAEAVRLARASPPDSERALLLLLGRSVPLTPAETPKENRRPPASGSGTSSGPRFTLNAVSGYVAEDLRTARRVVTDVAAVLTDLRPRLELLTAKLDEADARLGPTGDDGTRAQLGALRERVDRLWGQLDADPLALDPGSVAAIEADLAGLDRETSRRDAAVGRETVSRSGPNERDLLRARLEAYRFRALRLGRAALPEVNACYRRARRLLETEPCDLRQAGEAVHQYMSMERGDDQESHER